MWFRIDVPGEGVYRLEITVTGTDGKKVLVYVGQCGEAMFVGRGCTGSHRGAGLRKTCSRTDIG